MKLSFIRWGFLMSVIIFIWVNCANPTAPPGGPEDKKPPVIIKSVPEFYSVNFSSEQVRIYFDEFIQIKDLNTQLIISPPMDKQPDFKLKGKSLIISFNSPLKDNTTYNIYLGDAIVDLNAGNPIKNLSYIFTTGELIDSLSVKGKVVHAKTLLPEEDILVMLYKNISDTIEFDSLPFFIPPYYLSKTDDKGNFSLDYLSNDSFLIFALKDVNRNYIYDQPDEIIAFADSLINPWYIKREKKKMLVIEEDSISAKNNYLSQFSDTSSKLKDTIVLDNEIMNIDSIISQDDSIVLDTITLTKHPLIELLLFDELDSIQIISEARYVKKSYLQFVFKHPGMFNKVTLLNSDPEISLMIENKSTNGDTIEIWFTQDSLLKNLEFEIADGELILDTIDFDMPDFFSIKKVPLSYNKKELKVKPESPFILKFDYPVVDYHLDTVLLVENEDTINSKMSFIDELKMKARLQYKLKPEAKYKLLIRDSVITDISGSSNDSIQLSFSIADRTQLGNLDINLVLPDDSYNHIIELWLDDQLIKSYQTNSSQVIKASYLKPGNYFLVIIYDLNNNGRWDAGNYIYGIQPEKVEKFSKPIVIRENWDLTEDWDLSGKSETIEE